MPRGPGSRASPSNISVNYYHPLLFGGGFINRFDTVFNWSHTTQAFGGFDTAELDLAASRQMMEDWFENGLGRTVRAYDEAGVVIWEGFVDKVTVTDAGLEVSRGPLLDVGNKANLWYSSFAPLDDPNTGIRKKTPFAEVLESQRKYGILIHTLSSSGSTEVKALQIRDMYLKENSEPVTTTNFSFMPSVPSLTIHCKGYVHWLLYPYNSTTTGEITTTARIIDILADDPNGFISTDRSEIQTNSYLVPAFEDNDPNAIDVIKGTAIVGDADDNRWLFGIYEDRKPFYYPVPDEIEYHIHLQDQTRSVYQHGSDQIIMPWAVKPGRWIKFNDFLPGLEVEGTDLRIDPRNLFIETVVFVLPNQLTISGGRLSRLDQKLAKFGLSGISA